MTVHRKKWAEDRTGVYCVCGGWSLMVLPNRAGQQRAREEFVAHQLRESIERNVGPVSFGPSGCSVCGSEEHSIEGCPTGPNGERQARYGESS